MKLLHIVFLIFLIVCDGCVEPLKLEDYDSYKKQLVVDGMITDQPGPYTVSLYWSSGLNTDLDLPERVTEATITLFDDAGNQETLTETSPGKYQTKIDGIHGTIGRKYHLKILLNEKEYTSEEQEMYPAGDVTDLFAEFEEDAINRDDLTQPHDAIRVYCNARGEAGYPNLFRWRWNGTYEVETFPHLHVRYENNSPVPIPDPFPCSGYIVEDGVLRSVDTCSCCHCWVEETTGTALVSDNRFSTDDTFNKQLITTLPFIPQRFYHKYHLKLEQLSLSPVVYDFWRMVAAQQNSGGDIFQPNSIRIKGNVKCITDPEESVLGVFAVSAVTVKSFFIPRSLYKKPIYPDTITFPCQQAYRATNIKPIFW